MLNGYKILHIIPSLKLGGEEKFLIDIYPFLSKKFNHVVCPFIHTGELYTKTINIEKSHHNRFWIYVFKSQMVVARILKPLLFFYYNYKAWFFLKNEKPDIIITCTPMANFILCITTLCFFRKRHFKWYSRIGTHINPSDFSPTLSRNKIGYRILLLLMTFFAKLSVKNSDCFITVNHTLLNELITISHVDINKSFLLPVCLSNKVLLDKKLVKDVFFPTQEKQTFFVAAGRLEYIKGFDFLIKTFSLFVKHQPDIKLIIFGEGLERFALEKLIRSLNLQEKILLPGFIENPAASILNAIANIVPSRSEGFGKIIIEAMHHSSIVIASNCTGPREIINNGIDGVLFENENSEALLNAMHLVIKMSDENKIIMKNNAYQKSLHYSAENVASLLNTKLEMDCTL